jgi:nicotinate-nucleotide pyrophosphorylase (carboxylating)
MTALPHRHLVDDLIATALSEDLGRAGDITSASVIPAGTTATASLVARAPGTIAGLPIALRVFETIDESLTVTVHAADGATVTAGMVLAEIAGDARSILTAERTALNLLGHLSGIATATAELVAEITDTKAQIADTRKTTPGLRALEKYAVGCGGGTNHRFGLDDAVLIKDNHIAVAGGVTAAIKAARAGVGHLVKIELEVDTIDQLREGLSVGVDAVLLDNMDPTTLRTAVGLVDGAATTEASGGITLDTVRDVAETGVDIISVGWITHSAPSLDVALDITTGTS